jgi:hypothetical protein
VLSTLAILAATVALGGCATSSTQATIELEPTRIIAIVKDGQRVVEVLDPQVLYREAHAAFRDGDLEAAARKYGLIVEHFPTSRYGLVSRFNGGLALEKLARYAEAIPYFEALIAEVPGSKDAHDALFRLAVCQQALEQWDASMTTLDRILKPEWTDLVPIDQAEAYSLRGLARYRKGDLALAERDFLAALDVHHQHMGELVYLGSGPVSRAQFQIGEIYLELFRSIQFRLPLERMAHDLEDKSNYFLKSQNAFLKVVRYHHPDYAVKAGYKLGALFEQYYNDMLAAEVPRDLEAYELQVYFEELKKQVRPLLEKAIDVYERNIQMGERIGQQDEWLRRTEASLGRLKELLKQEGVDEATRALKDNGEKAAPPEPAKP